MKETAYLLQAVLISLWWLGLALSTVFFNAFQFDGIPPVAFWAFFMPDIILIGMLSLVRSYFDRVAIEYFILGAFGYATLYCLNATVLTSSGYLPTGLMLMGLAYNIFLCFSASLFRKSATGTAWNAIKTFVQIFCIWILALVVIPYILMDAFEAKFIPQIDLQTGFGICLFVLFSTLGLISAFFMVLDGEGTPLPLDQTNRLVVSGPYRYVRNPMAIAGIGQGIAVATVFQSVPVLVYALLGGIVWHVVVRPIEERDMIARFGQPYLDYRRRVSCWYPTLGNNESS